MKIHITTGPSRPKPKAGDRRVTKKHGLQIRVMVRDEYGRCIVSRGRQLYEWREPQHLGPHDRWLLEPDESAHYFPPERELGYMQQRGAA